MADDQAADDEREKIIVWTQLLTGLTRDVVIKCLDGNELDAESNAALSELAKPPKNVGGAKP